MSEQPDRVLVRPFVLTGGRTEPSHDLRDVTLVKLRQAPGDARPRSEESAQILTLCARSDVALTVSEIAARIGQPVQVAMVMISDHLDAGLLKIPAPPDGVDPRDPGTLEAVLAGLRQRAA